jgi:hypothetical protein
MHLSWYDSNRHVRVSLTPDKPCCTSWVRHRRYRKNDVLRIPQLSLRHHPQPIGLQSWIRAVSHAPVVGDLSEMSTKQHQKGWACYLEEACKSIHNHGICDITSNLGDAESVRDEPLLAVMKRLFLRAVDMSPLMFNSSFRDWNDTFQTLRNCASNVRGHFRLATIDDLPCVYCRVG